MSSNDLIRQADAARLLGVTRAAINDLIKRRKLRVIYRYGLPLVSREQVLNYVPEKGGRPPKKKVKV
jgi:hypothetical protein